MRSRDCGVVRIPPQYGVDDLINAMMLAAIVENIGGEAFQIASSQETTVGEITDKLVKILQKRGVETIEVVNGETRLGDVKRNFSDTTKALNILGWAALVDLDVGLEKTIDYFLSDK